MWRAPAKLDKLLIHITSTPTFRRIVTLDDGVGGRVEMFGCVLVRRGIATADMEEVAPSLAMAVRAATVNDDAEIEVMMARLAREEHSGLLILPDIFNNAHRDTIVALAAHYRLPAVYPFRFFVTAGGLMSYGIEISDTFRRATTYVDRILKGARPADLPVQAPVSFKTAVNLRTVKALGFTISPPLLVAADEVIE